MWDHIQIVHCAFSQDKQTDGTTHPNVPVAAILGVMIESTLSVIMLIWPKSTHQHNMLICYW
jgi:hypothetical protein